MKRLLKKLVPYFLIDKYHFLWALAGALFYGFPSKKIKVIGITGTNGKTTTLDLIARILEENNDKAAVLSSIKFKIGAKETENKLRMTMPGKMILQKFLRQAVNKGCKYALIEVTSEGIKQHRHRFIDFHTAIFTNLSPEHIEAHKGFENYKKAKSKLFKATKHVHIVNLDDENAQYFLQFPSKKKFCYGINCKLKIENCKFIKAANVKISETGINFSVNNIPFSMKLLGGFNVYNALAAICFGLLQEIDLQVCKRALAKAEIVPGRMELVISEPFKVFVDYAITPNALKQVYETIRKNWTKQKMICVLGACGGGRDKWKRPILGRLAAQHCDTVIVTNEDPYDEDAMEIIEQVAKGAGQKAEKILDRRHAIRKALESAQLGDVVVITGKGCEPSICLPGGKKIPWDDREVVREEFEEFNRSGQSPSGRRG